MIGTSLDRIDAGFNRRFASRPSWVALCELFLGVGWLRAAIAKMGDAGWWSGAEINEFIATHQMETVGWYGPITDFVASDTALWAAIVLALELAIGVALISSVQLGAGLFAGIFLNINFILVGSPNPSAFYLVLQLGLALWLLEESAAHAASMRWLRRVAAGCTLLGICCLPYARSLDPSVVIDDPALVLATWSFLGAFAAIIAHRRVRREELRASYIDLTTSPVTSGVRHRV